ncbi:alpha/beta fold hydrolase [Intestinibacter sp.]
MIPCIRHLKDIHCEVLVICGEKDKANKSASSQLAQLIPNAKAITIAGAGHEVNIDCPAKLGKELEKFF